MKKLTNYNLGGVKAFTLIELLGVLVIVALIVLIVAPNLYSTLTKGTTLADNQVKENIVLAARAWATDNKSLLPTTNNTSSVSLDTLQDEGYIEDPVVVPSTNEEITNACVLIENKEDLYYYEYDEECEITSSSTSNTYSVEYDYKTNCTGYTCTSDAPTTTQTGIYNGSKVALSYSASKPGWTFVGWNTNKNAKTGLKTYTVTNSNVKLYAIYRHNGYTYLLSTDGNGATSGSATYSTCNTGFTYNNDTPSTTCKAVLPANNFIRTDYIFKGWNTDKTATSGKSAKTTVTLSGNTTYYAIWKGNPPTCTLSLSGTEGSNGYYKSNVKVTMTLSGGTANSYGLATTKGSTNGNLSATQKTDTTGTIYYGYAENNAGSTTCDITVMKDTTSPTCKLKVTSGTKGSNDWYTTNVKVGWSTKTDETSGIAGYDLTTSTSASYNSGTSATLSSDTSGTTYYGYVKDKAGNTGKCSMRVKRDATKPTLSVTWKQVNCSSTSSCTVVGTLSGSMGSSWSRYGLFRYLTPSDSTSGVSGMQYSTDNSTWYTENNYVGSSNLDSTGYSGCTNGCWPTNTQGQWAYYWRVTDKAGNVSSSYYITFNIDWTAPQLSSYGTYTWNNDWGNAMYFDIYDNLSGISSSYTHQYRYVSSNCGYTNSWLTANTYNTDQIYNGMSSFRFTDGVSKGCSKGHQIEMRLTVTDIAGNSATYDKYFNW